MYLTSKWNPSIEPSGVCKVIRSLISDQWGTKDLTSLRPSQQKVQRISPSADLTRIFGVRNHSALSGFSEKCPSLMVWFAFPLLLLFYFNHVQRICAIYCHFSMTVGGINSEAVPASKTTQILFRSHWIVVAIRCLWCLFLQSSDKSCGRSHARIRTNLLGRCHVANNLSFSSLTMASWPKNPGNFLLVGGMM